MAKYSLEFKLEVVAYYNLGHGYTNTANHFNVAFSVVVAWVRYFKTQGSLGLKVVRKPPNYTLKFKISVLRYMQEHNLSYLNTATHFNITAPSTVRQWYLKHKKGGVLALKPQVKIMKKTTDKPQKAYIDKTDEEKTNKQLLKELEYLRAENAYLKKLDALLQEKKKQQKK